MTERELRRTALIIPPRGRAVLCCWAAIPGLLAAPFVFWQSMPAGVVFCLLWAALVHGSSHFAIGIFARKKQRIAFTLCLRISLFHFL